MLTHNFDKPVLFHVKFNLPIIAICINCGKENVLCSSIHGICGICEEEYKQQHEHDERRQMFNPQVCTCPKCGQKQVLCCSECGFCGNCGEHSECESIKLQYDIENSGSNHHVIQDLEKIAVSVEKIAGCDMRRTFGI